MVLEWYHPIKMSRLKFPVNAKRPRGHFGSGGVSISPAKEDRVKNRSPSVTVCLIDL
ncbi:MAG: hypothetical protein GHCLOJNM_02132 [bacterium]|nr:hypothetical protein [bacterium]